MRRKLVPDMRFETLPDWLQWLEQQHPKAIDLGLERVATVASRLSLSSLNSTVITVAGTNGKGSFVASMQALLLSQNKTVASYTSPHMFDFNERYSINGQFVLDEDIIQAFAVIDKACDDISLSYFEYTTLAAFYLFKQVNVDYCILEIGLGGRLDAVNIIDPDWAVITSIGIDHQDYLGSDINGIAKEKCGILRADTPLICAEINPPKVLQDACDERDSWRIGHEFSIQHDENDTTWRYVDRTNKLSSPKLKDTGLAVSSQAAAIQLMSLLFPKVCLDDELVALARLQLPGRFQCFNDDGISVILDVAHNPQAVNLLKQRLQQRPLATGNKRLAVFTMLADKDVESVIIAIKDEFSAWFVSELDHPRAIAGHKLADLINQQQIYMISVSKNVRQAYARAKSLCQEGDEVVVFGSFFTVAEILSKLRKSKKVEMQ